MDVDDNELLEMLSARMAEHQLRLKNVMGDGNCLFYAACDQKYGFWNKNLATRERQDVTSLIENNADFYSSFLNVDPSARDEVATSERDVDISSHGLLAKLITIVFLLRLTYICL